jgi:hypothetical protein
MPRWLSVLLVPAIAHAAPRPTVHAAAEAMGGEAKLRAIANIHYTTIGHWSSVEASERPEPPWNLNYTQGEVWLDFSHRAWREDSQFLSPSSGTGAWQRFGLIVSDGASAVRFDGKVKPGGPVYLGDADEQLLYQPFRLVLAALDAPDLRAEPDDQLAGQPVQVVAFHHRGWPVRLWLDARTHRLAAAEITHALPDDYFWRMRGDVRDRLIFSQWALHASGVWFARQYDLVRAGIPYHSYVITTLEPNAAAPDTFAIPDDLRAQYKATARGPSSTPAAGEQPLAELAPGIWFAAARWNALLVAQPAGALLIDAPVSDVYVGRALDELQHRFHKPAQAVILSDHITPQLSGVREAAARGIPIRALDANRAFVEALLAAPHTLVPDALARSATHPTVTPVTARTSLGDGPTRVELIPLRGSRGERILLVWLPAAKLLWTASLIALSDGHPDPSRLAELDAAVAREHLTPDRLVGASLPPTPWAALHKP